MDFRNLTQEQIDQLLEIQGRQSDAQYNQNRRDQFRKRNDEVGGVAAPGRGQNLSMSRSPGGEAVDALRIQNTGDPTSNMMQYISKILGSQAVHGQAGIGQDDVEQAYLGKYGDMLQRNMMSDQSMKEQKFQREMQLSQPKTKQAAPKRLFGSGERMLDSVMNTPQQDWRGVTGLPRALPQNDPYEELRQKQIEGRKRLMDPDVFKAILMKIRGF